MNQNNTLMKIQEAPTGFALTIHNWKKSLKTPTPYLMFIGVSLWIGAYYLLVEGWQLPRFNKLPGPVEVITEWINPDPDWGISMFSPIYYEHIIVSCRRIVIAFAIATCVGVPLGLFMGWSKIFRDYSFHSLFCILLHVPLLNIIFILPHLSTIFLLETRLVNFSRGGIVW